MTFPALRSKASSARRTRRNHLTYNGSQRIGGELIPAPGTSDSAPSQRGRALDCRSTPRLAASSGNLKHSLLKRQTEHAAHRTSTVKETR